MLFGFINRMERPPVHSGPTFSDARLEALPQALVKLIELCRAQNTAADSLVKVIATDPALTLQSFHTARSLEQSNDFKSLDLSAAVSKLGVQGVHLMASKMLSFQNGLREENRDPHPTNVWQHSLLCANVANRLAAQLDISSPDNAYLAGLLHDTGKLLDQHAPVHPRTTPPTLTPPRQEKSLGDRTGQQAEYCKTGAQYVYACCGNRYIADAIRYHQEPLERVQTALPLVKLIYLANLLSKAIVNGDAPSYHSAKTLFGLSSRAVDGIVIAAQDETAKTSRAYGILTLPSPSKYAAVLRSRGNRAIQSEIGLTTLWAGVLDQLMRADDSQAVLLILLNTVQIEFGLPRPVFLQYVKTGRRLAGRVRQGSGGLENNLELIIDLDKTGGLMVEAFDTNRILHTLEAPPELKMCLADSQIRHLMGSSEMVCIPVNGRQTALGLLVIGFNEHNMQLQDSQLKTLKNLTDYVGMRLDDLARPDEPAANRDFSAINRNLMTRRMIHEVNNPLGIIKNYLGVLKFKLPEDHPVLPETAIIEEEIDRIKTMLTQYADFAAPDDQQETTDVNALIKEMLALIETSVNASAELTFQTQLDLVAPAVTASKDKLKQVLLNLLLNAAEAMPAGGEVLIHTQFIPASVFGNDDAMPNITGKIQIIIKDDGPGIPDEIRSNLFQPFRTSKTNQYAGLGLSIVYNLMLELNGTITCDSSDTNGTMFTLTLPAHG